MHSLSPDAEIHLPKTAILKQRAHTTARRPERPPSDELRPAALDERRLDALQARTLPGGALLHVAADRRSRARGLAGLTRLRSDRALLIEPCRSVHTIGMRFALDLLWLDAAGKPIRLDANVPPRRLRTCLRARAVIETGAGHGDHLAEQLAAARPA